MISAEVAVLRDALIAVGTTNSESQATKWAIAIIEKFEAQALVIVHENDLDGG